MRVVRASSSATTAEAARRLGISAATLRRRAQAGTIRAVIDQDGRYHFPRVLPGAPMHGKKRKKAGKRLGQTRVGKTARPSTPRAPAPIRPVSAPRKKKRAPVRSAPPPPPPRKKKLRAGKKARAQKRVQKKVVRRKKVTPPPAPTRPSRPAKKRRSAPPPPRRPKRKKLVRRKKKRTAVAVVSTPSAPFGVPIQPFQYEPPKVEVTRARPMPMDMAAKMVGEATRDYVMARFAIEREASHQSYFALRHAFRQTYGNEAWHDTFDWIVDEWDLEPYIIDREALENSDVRES